MSNETRHRGRALVLFKLGEPLPTGLAEMPTDEDLVGIDQLLAAVRSTIP